VDVRLQNENGDTALIAASANGHTAIVTELLKRHKVDVDKMKMATLH
jgi:ankyrin repeat protein